MLTASFISMPNSLDMLLKNAGPVTRRKALREALTYLRRINVKRIKSNLTPDGLPMKDRSKGTGKMFRSITKQMKRIQRGDFAELGFYGSAGRLAANHHYGRTIKTKTHDIEMPVRKLLGINIQDAKAVHAIFIKHLLQGVQL
ncbi:phage virion morphogenesis protein [Leucothrix sargassi]|nr:phage virion morphogenesis protein [Leucothrix sargassi]